MQQEFNNVPEEPDESELISFHGFRMSRKHMQRFKKIYEKKHKHDANRDLSDLNPEDREYVSQKEFPDIGEMIEEEEQTMPNNFGYPPEGYLNQRQLADILGISPTKVRLMVKRNALTKEPNGFYILEKCQKEFLAYENRDRKRGPYKKRTKKNNEDSSSISFESLFEDDITETTDGKFEIEAHDTPEDFLEDEPKRRKSKSVRKPRKQKEIPSQELEPPPELITIEEVSTNANNELLQTLLNKINAGKAEIKKIQQTYTITIDVID
jgi:hypothetical protein